jgi:hypothetical protein
MRSLIALSPTQFYLGRKALALHFIVRKYGFAWSPGGDGGHLIFTLGIWNFFTTPLGSMGKGREPQIVLKTEQGTVALGHWRQGEISAKSNGWDENRIFPEGRQAPGRGQERPS